MVFPCFFDGFLHARDLLISRLSATYLRDNLYTSGMHGFRPTFARACLFHSRPRLTALQPYVHPRFPATGSHLYTFPRDLFPMYARWKRYFREFSSPFSSPSLQKLTHIYDTLETTGMINFLESVEKLVYILGF